MTGSWIKFRTDLATDPAVIRIGAILGLDTFAVMGRLATVWVWADTHADRHGTVTLVTRDCLDSLTQCAGFGAAMESVGWLESRSGEGAGIIFPRFDRHMGEGAKARAQAAKRKRRQRSREYSNCHDMVTLESQNSVTREEESREEKKEDKDTPQPPADAGASSKAKKKSAKTDPPGFAAFWSAYPRKTAKGDALKAFAKLAPDDTLLAQMLTALSWQARSDGWVRDGGKFIPHPATWLNGRRWDDEPPRPPPRESLQRFTDFDNQPPRPEVS